MAQKQSGSSSDNYVKILVDYCAEAMLLMEKEGKILAANPAACGLFGYTEAEFIGRMRNEIIDENDPRCQQLCLELEDSQNARKKIPCRRRDGTIFLAEVACGVYRVAPGQDYISMVLRVLPEQQAPDLSGKNKEMLFRLMFETAPIGFAIADQNQKVLLYNEAVLKPGSYTREEFSKVKDISDFFFDPKERDKIFDEMKEIGFLFRKEVLFKRIDGSPFNTLFSLKPIDVDGVPYVLAVIEDVTERKQTEETLKKSESQFRLIWEKSADGMRLIDGEGTIVMVNDAFCRMVGMDRLQLIGQSLSIVYDTPRRDYIIRRHRENFAAGTFVADAERRMVLWNGQPVHFEVSNSIYKVEGEPPLLLSIFRDITKRKEAERQMQMLAQALRNIGECVYVTDLNQNILFVNEAFLWTYGFALDELLDQHINLTYAPYQPVDLAGTIMQSTLQGGWQGEILNRRKDGRIFPVLLTTATVKDDIGNPIALIGVLRDISERKEAEDALRSSERKYRQIIDFAPVGFYQTNPDGNFLATNMALVRILGYDSVDELLHLNIGEHIYVNKTQRAQLIRQHGKQDLFSDIEVQWKKKNGELIWVQITGNTIRHTDGSVDLFEAFVLDITERKRVEEQSRLQTTALQSAANAIAITDREGRITWINPAFTTLTGYTTEEVLGKNPRLLKSGKHHADFYKKLWMTIIEGRVWRGEVVNKRKDGTLYTELMTITPVRDPQGNISHFIAIKEDITEQQKLQAQLLQAQKMESLGTLAGGVAHDFNNILGIILGHSSMLDRVVDDPAKHAKSLDAVQQAVHRGSTLVRQILTFARRTELSAKLINVNDIVREVASMLMETFPKTITFSQVLDKNLSAISADQNQIHQALVNLCVNARDAMSAGGVLTIRTSTWQGRRVRERFGDAVENRYVCIEVEDTGVGMDEYTRSRIFEPFFTTKELGKGTGLGMAVVYGIVQSHRGFIEAESEFGKGTTIRLFLPGKELDVKEEADEKKGVVQVPRGTEMILVVEDEQLLIDLLNEDLSNAGYKVIVARDGAEAVALYHQHISEVALVLSDMGLPKMTGMEAFVHMKTLNPKIKAILATGFLDPDLRSELLKLGVREIVQKPYSLDKLLVQIREVIDSQ